MNSGHFTLFISDLHLDPALPQVTETFFHFLNTVAPKADALYILGDFFEVYIGDDDHSPLIQSVKQHLLAFTRTGTPVYFMHGNRDFLVGKKFARDTGVTLITDPTCINLYQQKLLLMHGDSLCTHDVAHQRFRRIIHNKLAQKVMMACTLSFRKKIGAKLRHDSQQMNQQKSATIMDVALETVIKEMKKHQVRTMIHGHTHRCATHRFSISDQQAQRIVLDSWHHHGNYLKISEDGKTESINIPFLTHAPLP